MPLLTDKLFPLQIISNLELSAQSYLESILLSIFVMYTGVWWYRRLSVWRRWEKLYNLWQWGYHFNREGLYYAFCWTFLRNFFQLKNNSIFMYITHAIGNWHTVSTLDHFKSATFSSILFWVYFAFYICNVRRCVMIRQTVHLKGKMRKTVHLLVTMGISFQ